MASVICSSIYILSCLRDSITVVTMYTHSLRPSVLHAASLAREKLPHQIDVQTQMHMMMLLLHLLLFNLHVLHHHNQSSML